MKCLFVVVFVAAILWEEPMSEQDKKDHLALMQARYGFVPGTNVIFDPEVKKDDLSMLGDTWKRFVRIHERTQIEFVDYLPSENYKVLGTNGVHIRFADGNEYCMSVDP